jgi:IclR family transcriptional regulator, pca regulon regulatory protein
MLTDADPISGPFHLSISLSNMSNILPASPAEPVHRPRSARRGEAGLSQSLERGLSILSAFRGDRVLLGTTELARELGLGVSTTHRYIATLAQLGYVEQDPTTRRYRLGFRVVDLGFAAINSMEIRQIASPHLQRLSNETGFTVNMAILDGTEIVYVDRYRSNRPGQRQIDLNLHVGARLPAYCTSLGKALLANLHPEERHRLVESMTITPLGPNTFTTVAALTAELDSVRASGLAVNNEELAYGLRSIAVPVRGVSGDAVAAINLSFHTSMGAVSMSEMVSRYGPLLRKTASSVEARVGFHNGPHQARSGRR